MIMLLYSLALTLALLISAPWWLVRMLTTERYREGLGQRLGAVPAALKTFAAGHKIIWLHAVSVGEVLAATRLVTELEAALGNDYRIVISTTTRTGQHLARDRFGAHRVFYMPLDFAFAVRAYLRVLQPQALILMESELWPRLLHECSTRSIPVIVANARVSDRTFTRTLRFRKLWQHMARHVTLFLAQSDLDAERFTALGSYKNNVRTTGNLKYDVRTPKDSWVAELIQRYAAGRPIIVAGSTVSLEREYEDLQVIAAWRHQPRENYGALLIIAPRHPENFKATEHRAHGYRVFTTFDLKLGAHPKDAFTETGLGGDGKPVEIIILDTIGDLAAVYGLADVAFVGGSLVNAGGHNPLEPAQLGVPVVMGQSVQNFRAIVEAMQSADAIRLVPDDVELEKTFVELLSNPQAARAMGERGRQVFEQQQGATQRTVEAILTLVRP